MILMYVRDPPLSMSDFIDQMTMASLLECSTDKPGNVGPNQTINGITYQNYKDVILELNAFSKIFFKNFGISKNSDLTIGKYIRGAVRKMIETPPHKNLLLGHILLYAPLLFAYNHLLQITPRQPKISWDQFWISVELILSNTTVDDGIDLYHAINNSEAGGLINPGSKKLPTKYDFTLKDVEVKIRSDQKTLLDLFAESSSFDNISDTYISRYSLIKSSFREILKSPYFKNISSEKRTLFIFIYLLSEYPDSLIFRKNNLQVALDIQAEAKNLMQTHPFFCEENKTKMAKLNQKMEFSAGLLNPGTTADLTACILFLMIIFNKIPIITLNSFM